MFVVIVKFNDFDKKMFGLFRSAFDASDWAYSQKWIDDVVWSIDLINFVKKGKNDDRQDSGAFDGNK